MPKIEYCELNGVRVEIARAVVLRDDARSARNPSQLDPDFRCPECNESVRPHKAGPDAQRSPAHFEHLDRNSVCTLSHRARR